MRWVAGVLVAACALMRGCIPIMAHAMIEAESKQKVEWQRQNFEREKLGMPVLTWEEWKARGRTPGQRAASEQSETYRP